MADYYEILGVSRNASQEEIKRKYRTLALKMHPDRLVGKTDIEKKQTEKKFQEITNAYETLSNEDSRNKYDQESVGGFGRNNYSSGFNSGSSFEEIVESFFSSGREKYSSKSDLNSPRKGEDMSLILNLSFKESVLGLKKDFSIDLLKACSKCSQTGAYSENHIKNCTTCNGRKIVDVVQRTIFGNIRTQVTCTYCKGRGKIISKKCDLCKGSKFVSQKEIIEITVPRGIKPGTILKKKSSGNDGLYSSQKGDISIELKFKKHDYFQRKENDIVVQVPISFIDSILGSEIEVITIEGVEKVFVPIGSQFNDQIIIKNKGFYTDINKKTRGDFCVNLQIRMPKKISKETEKIFDEMKKKSTWNPNKRFLEENKSILNES